MPTEDSIDRQTKEAYSIHSLSVAHISNDEDAKSFFAWARRFYPMIAPELFNEPKPENNSRLAYWAARSIWNATPLESNRFRPKPLPRPNRNGPCPCGSGRKFKQCCRGSVQFEQTSTRLTWPLLASCRSDAYWLAAEESGRLPLVGFLHVGIVLRDEERWRSLRKLAEHRLADEWHLNDDRLAIAIDWLCDAYGVLHRTDRKKEALLKRFAAHKNRALRATANQRLASWLLDQGESERAWQAFAVADRAQPKSPANALLEMTMLSAEGRLEWAAKRAGQWLALLERDADAPEEILAGLRRFQKDPGRALDDQMREFAPREVQELLNWIDDHEQRPLPSLRWEALNREANDTALQEHQQVIDSATRKLEEEWQALSQGEKPFSTNPFSGAEPEVWDLADDWLPWLREHPEAMDSFSILDDLVLLLLDADADEQLGKSDNRWIRALLNHGVAMLGEHWPPGRPGIVPWVMQDNRPALRILSNCIQHLEYDWSDDHLEHCVRLYMRLNPNDNHGYRWELVNHLLTVGRDAEVLACTEHYPDDMAPEIQYGRVLALYRLGRHEEAEAALQKAMEYLPAVLKYLLPGRVAKPKFSRHGIRVGGDDQAWLYRDAMRKTWMQTKGMRKWLTQAAKAQEGEKKLPQTADLWHEVKPEGDALPPTTDAVQPQEDAGQDEHGARQKGRPARG